MCAFSRAKGSMSTMITGATLPRGLRVGVFANGGQESLAWTLLELAAKALILWGLFCLVAAAQVASTSTRLIVSPVSATVGDAVTLTAAVGSGGASVSSGSVTFYDGLTPIG